MCCLENLFPFSSSCYNITRTRCINYDHRSNGLSVGNRVENCFHFAIGINRLSRIWLCSISASKIQKVPLSDSKAILVRCCNAVTRDVTSITSGRDDGFRWRSTIDDDGWDRAFVAISCPRWPKIHRDWIRGGRVSEGGSVASIVRECVIDRPAIDRGVTAASQPIIAPPAFFNELRLECIIIYLRRGFQRKGSFPFRRREDI